MADATPSDDLRGPARIAMVAAMMVIATFIAGKAARDGILLAEFDVELLPLFVGTSAAGSLPLVLLFGKLIEKHGPGRLLPAVNAVSALLLVGEWLLLEGSPELAAILVFYHLSTLGAVLVSGFWSIVNERFDAQVAKRHIGRIGMAATVGGIVGGVVAERTAVYFDYGAVLLVLAALQLGCAVMLRGLSGPRHAERPAEPDDDRWSAIRTIMRTALLRNLTFVIVLGAIGAAALDYVFKAEVTAATDRQGTLRFFAIYYTTTNILTAVVQTLFSRAVVSRVGVARSVSVLPATVTVFGFGALAIGGLMSAVAARSAEMVMRSSVYRAAYELVYAPLPPERKRSTKVLIDVGAERIGDLLGAQLVAILIGLVAAPRSVILIAAVAAGVTGLVFAFLLPRAYTAALEHSLVTQAKDTDADVGGERSETDAATSWNRFSPPTMTEAGDLTAMSLLNLRAQRKPPSASSRWRMRLRRRKPPVATPPAADLIPARVLELRSGDVVRVQRALATPLPPELAPLVVPLVEWDPVAPAATAALRAIAPQITGLLVDALLDQERSFIVRRRIPAILVAGEPMHAAWGLWHGLEDARFEVRFRCVRALAKLREQGHELAIATDDVFAIMKRELSVAAEVWRDNILDEEGGEEDAHVEPYVRERLSRGVEHVFALLALVLPPEPVRIALHGLHTDDRELRATALEYLESVLPADVRALLWPLVQVEDAAEHAARSSDELANELRTSLPSIVENLRALSHRS